jgi:hypothetical protein
LYQSYTGDLKDEDEKTITYTPINPTLLCESININSVNKKLVVKAITSGIFKNIPNIMKMVKNGVDLEVYIYMYICICINMYNYIFEQLFMCINNC